MEQVDYLKDEVGELEIPASHIWGEYKRDWAERLEELEGKRQPWLYSHYNMSEVGTDCIRRLSYPILKISAPIKPLSEKELVWKKLGCMSASIGKVVHRRVQAKLQESGVLTKETTEQRIENLIPTYNLVGKYDGLVQLEFDEDQYPKVILEIKTWNKSKLYLKRGSRFGGDDQAKLAEYALQVQPMLHALGLQWGLIFTIDVGYFADDLLRHEDSMDTGPQTLTLKPEHYEAYLVKYERGYVEKRVLDRAAKGLEATNKQKLPDGEPWLGDGFCPWASYYPYVSWYTGHNVEPPMEELAKRDFVDTKIPNTGVVTGENKEFTYCPFATRKCGKR